MKRLLILCTSAIVLWGGNAQGAVTRADPFVRWTTEGASLGECISWEALKEDVESRLERRVFVPTEEGGPPFDLELRSTTTIEVDLFRIQLVLMMSDGTEVGERELSAHSCDELKVLLPPVVALLLGPYDQESTADAPATGVTATTGAETDGPPLNEEPASTEPPTADEPSTPQEEPPAQEAPAKQKPTLDEQEPSPEVTRPDGQRPAWLGKFPPWCAASAGLLFGYGPEPTLRALVGCGVSPLPLLTLALDAELRFPSGQEDPRFSVRGFGGRASGCLAPHAPLSLGGCLALSVVRTNARAEVGEDARQQEGRTAVEGSLFARVRYQRSRFLVQLDAGIALPSERPRYTLIESSGNESLLYQPGRIFPSVDWGVGLVFE